MKLQELFSHIHFIHCTLGLQQAAVKETQAAKQAQPNPQSKKVCIIMALLLFSPV